MRFNIFLVLAPLALATTFLPQKATYDAALGLQVLHYAKAAYCPQSTLKTWTCGPTCSYFKMTNVHVYLNTTHDI